MDVVIWLAGVCFALLVAHQLLNHWPRSKRTLEDLRMGGWLHGFILFGRLGSVIYWQGPEKRDRLEFVKVEDSARPWCISATISDGPTRLPKGFEEQLRSDLAPFAGRVEVDFESPDEGEAVRFRLTGHGVEDPVTLEAVARQVILNLRHEPTARYRLNFVGPKNWKAVNTYYGFRKE